MSAPLEHYAMIGDGESAALVCKSGSIDWTFRRCRRTSRSSTPKAFAPTLLKGDPDEANIISRSVNQLAEELLR